MKNYRNRNYKRHKKLFILRTIAMLIVLCVIYFGVKKIISTNNSKETISVVSDTKPTKKVPDTASASKDDSKDKSNKNTSNNHEIEKDIKNTDTNENTTKVDSNTSNKEFFKDSVFLGDSLTEGFSFYDKLNENNVVSKKGLSIPNAKPQIDKVISLKPKNIFILLGENDINDVSANPNSVIINYKNMINSFKKDLPNSNIYALSILNVTKKAQANHPGLCDARVNQYNNQLNALCQNMNISYIDIRNVLSNNLYEQDGIHVKSAFYDVILNYVRKYTTNN